MSTNSATVAQAAIQEFMKSQVIHWNNHDRERFMALYRELAPISLDIQYAGRETKNSGWFIIEEMWDKHNSQFRLEVVSTIFNGHEVAVRHRNCIIGVDAVIESIETYRFEAGSLSVCYFLKPPEENIALEQFRGFSESVV